MQERLIANMGTNSPKRTHTSILMEEDYAEFVISRTQKHIGLGWLRRWIRILKIIADR
jgi:hypothetical protein